MKSSAHSRIIKLVDSDLKHLESYFGEVKNRLTVSLKDKKLVDNKSNLLTKFMTYFENKNGHQDELYQECSLEFVKLLQSELKVKDQIFFTKMTICSNPFKYLAKNIDFGLFYEAEDEELQKIINKNPELKN